MKKSYEDIINLPRPVSNKHPPMDRANRAAQFAPFAALTGHEAAIKETARVTEARRELTEQARSELDRKLQHLISGSEHAKMVTITYFVPDVSKAGGAYRQAFGAFEKLEVNQKMIVLQGGIRIPVAEIAAIE